jgi:hypothetical protein
MLERFLRLCRPSAEPVPARRLPARERVPWMLAGFWESRFLHVPKLIMRTLRAPGLAWDIACAAPLLLQVRRVLRRRQDVRDVLIELTPAAVPTVRSSLMTRVRTVRAIFWATRLRPLGGAEGRCLRLSLAVYAALRRQGWDVTFVSGVRRDATGLQGHAWVEENGQGLAELAGRERVWEYVPSFRYPPTS